MWDYIWLPIAECVPWSAWPDPDLQAAPRLPSADPTEHGNVHQTDYG